MPEFDYEYADAQGNMHKGSMAADSAVEAVRRLNVNGQTVVDVSERAAPSAGLLRRRLSAQEVVVALHELATLLEAGVSLSDAVLAQGRGSHHPALAEAFANMATRLGRGENFLSALRACNLPLPDYVLQLVEAGELSGRLAQALRQAVSQLEYDNKVAADFRGALAYPAILIVAGLAAVMFVFVFVVPRFSNLLDEGNDLPLLAEVILRTGLWFNDNSALVFAVAGGAVAATVLLLRQAAFRQRLYDFLALLPVLKDWFSEADTARWASVMSAMLTSRVELMDALGLALRGIRISRRRGGLEQAAGDVRSGAALSDALERRDALTATGYNLVRVGEQSGQLAEMLRSLATLYEENSSRRMKRFLNLVEPLAILLIGGFLGTIMVGIILAITSINEGVL